jgi:hypothetical protein
MIAGKYLWFYGSMALFSIIAIPAFLIKISNVRAFHPFQNKVVYMHPVSDTLYILNGQGNVENGYYLHKILL